MEKTKKIGGSFLLDITKGSIFSLVISMILIIAFAIIIRFANVSDALILPINQVIKSVSLLLGIILSLKGGKKGLIKGLLIGITYSILSYIVFSVLSNTLTFGLTSITDLLFNAVLGCVCGLIAVNIKTK